ncbi:MAG: copper homeostasis periplasmic binding protein CopC [Candidatus Andeanibacterium colombiense]|uniref:Copper homeostasis periplasmic binding protein CopC n=1 Tax=Candidatus Andeanibacterium colombiense TaxID=3121345 RepID=A0AAJ6BND4_9SPHN|nr:MAG: copper homeostasis periplasmic binding protein CopC [Sphingomonadaceae bacterium]
MKTLSPIAAIAAAALLAMSGPAFAHAKLVKSNPSADATVHAGLKTITLTFDDPLVAAFSKFTLSMPGMAMPVKTAVSPDKKSIVGTLPAPLTKGAYTVSWTAASDDGHKTTGTLKFKVG